MDPLTGMIKQLPGLIIEHWFVASIAGIVFLCLVYVVVIKVWFAAEDVRDVRRRNRNL